MDKSKQPFHKHNKQPFHKHNKEPFHKHNKEPFHKHNKEPFHKHNKEPFHKHNKEPFHKHNKEPFHKYKYKYKLKHPFRKHKHKPKRSFRMPLPRIRPGDRIDYRNMSLINRFVSEQGKILPRRVSKLTLRQQRLMTIAIKQARILSSLPFINSEIQFEKTKSIFRATGPRTIKK